MSFTNSSNVVDYNSDLEEGQPIFRFSYRGVTAAIGAWQLAWGFFMRNFSGPFGKWIQRGGDREVDFLPEIGLILMLTGAVCLFLAAYPIRYRVLYLFLILTWVSIAFIFITGVFADIATKQLYFHVIINYGITSIILVWIVWKAHLAAKVLSAQV